MKEMNSKAILVVKNGGNYSYGYSKTIGKVKNNHSELEVYLNLNVTTLDEIEVFFNLGMVDEFYQGFPVFDFTSSSYKECDQRREVLEKMSEASSIIIFTDGRWKTMNLNEALSIYFKKDKSTLLSVLTNRIKNIRFSISQYYGFREFGMTYFSE